MNSRLPNGVALREAKRLLRDRVLAARDALTAEDRANASTKIADRVGGLSSFAAATCLLVTIPFRNEWDSRILAARALSLGKTLAAPRVDPTARTLSLHQVCDLATDLTPGYRGIPEPTLQCGSIAVDAIDWVLVPGVAFDPQGRRLGYGGGYYDRLLPLLSRSAPRVAAAFELQLVAEVPAAAHDVRVDCIVTEARVVDCGRA